MTEVINCPSCNRRLRLADDLVGRQVQCPGCAATFAAGESGADDRPRGRIGGARRGSEARTDRDYCTECGEPAPVGAVACPNCGEFLEDDDDEEDERPWDREGAIRRDCEPHRGTLVMVLGIISVAVSPLTVCGLFSIPFAITALSLGVSSWVMGRGDLRKMNQRSMDPQGRGQTQAGMVCGIVATSVACLSVLGWGAFLLIAFLGGP
ncbi:MAG TPA: hypothetical protein VG013_33090 [Gemmataceae bacterium]|jgi:hypothetical protein|nr:hypothetical protein [Gemmataceae bacterium]